MKTLYILFFYFQAVITMAQYTEKELIASYEYREIASGERAKWDHANYYTTLVLKDDGSFLKIEQTGRLTAQFSYEYGIWHIESNYVLVEISYQATEKQSYHKTKEGKYENNPYSENLIKEKYSRFYKFEIFNPWKDKVRGLKDGDILYQH